VAPGRHTGVLTALASAAIVFVSAAMDPVLFAHPLLPDWVRWTNLGLWAGFLFLTSAAVSMLAQRERRQLEQVEAAYMGVLEIMAKFIDSIDRSTDNHSRRVAERAIEVGRHLGLGDTEVETLRVAAYLHDVGKVEISAGVLRKAAELTDTEHAEMKLHVDHGSKMIARLGGLLEDVVPLVLYHHERWDGAGYKGLEGEAIRWAPASSRSATPTTRSSRTARIATAHRISRRSGSCARSPASSSTRLSSPRSASFDDGALEQEKAA